MSSEQIQSSAELPGVPNAFQHLWTPHRLVYIQHGQQPADHECPFCLAVNKTDEDALIVFRGEHAYALLNLFPYNSGHMLVCPYRHIATYDQATPEEVAEIAALTQQAMRVLKSLSLIHISEPTRRTPISYAVFCLKKIFFLMIRRPPRSTLD